ncbi:MAG TPA: hypothetical protein VIL65_06785 [Beijerinckiaceae bacterium]|jgi:hypothetical protein
MPSHPDELQAQATEAITRLREAALTARHLHARAELARHMRTTAEKVRGRPRAEAVDFVTREWMQAWQLDAAANPSLAAEIQAYVAAVCADAEAGTDATDQSVRDAFSALEAGFLQLGTTLADQMAFRSECAHGWWALVVPVPDDLPARPGVPTLAPGQPFWEVGCARHCRPSEPEPDEPGAAPAGPELS